MRHILIGDDDKEIVQLIAIYLQNEGYKISRAFNGEEALALFEKEKIDLIILDVMMPKVDGMEVCRILREKNHVPILMISAKTEDIDKITGLMSGADDYLTKPFNPLELVARVKTLIRRTYLYQDERVEDEIIKVGSLEVNKTFHTAKVSGRSIQLTSKEFAILHIMVSNLGRVFSSEEIFELVWKETYYSSNNTVMVHISNLREKLEKELGYKLIKTIWGVGYKIDG
ncbi:response regulator transcription factor [Neobacillus vireti]|uniref:Winged helix family two component transcriptional regulator n=1 Tax=Neobacillus vireti LMG 21834 TaxID=1131730 RepID=A0AB94IV16_9BACI|nr:response regulator transcription factor [Neobacillus vireti]ETI70803.1 winged helix family two component transcriptional regulator [Neobacillus vireti LMG 21834]KLT17656.1 PhoB family transcriptional regulator [Neobacillus vireti]